MKTLTPLLKWEQDGYTLIFKLNENSTYSPYISSLNNNNIYEECKRQKLLQYSFEYLEMLGCKPHLE